MPDSKKRDIAVMRRFTVGKWIWLVVLVLACGVPQRAYAAPIATGTKDYQAGLVAARAGHAAAAAHDFEQALLHGHTDPATFYQLGLAYQQLKRLNDATWALATAASDPVFTALTPAVTAALQAVSNAGGVSAGPPALLRDVKMTPQAPTPGLIAQMESRSATAALQGSSVYYVAPVFNRQITMSNATDLTQAAADLQNNSSTSVKFVFLSAVPTPYTSLSDYARDLLSALHLQRAVVVVVTPQAAGAYSDRLAAADATRIAAEQFHRAGAANPAGLAVAIAWTINEQADDNEAASTRRSTILGIGFALLVLALVVYGVWRVGWHDSRPSGQRQRRAATSTAPRVR